MLDMFRDLQKNKTILINNKEFPVRFSIGGACSTAYSYDILKDQADKEMYLDKEKYYETRKKYR